ncbi:MAG: AAA family ATPase, partial [Opitutales bacterium]|nr:AAA family ATPase [Opitutales bacterium]
DALTLACLGYNAVSVPFGAKADASDGRANSGNAWIENDWEWLSKFTRIKICMDNDEAGRAAAATLMNRLNLDRTELVEIPDSDFGKDANDLFRGDVNLLKSAVENSRPLDPATLGRVMDYRAKIKSLFFPADERAEGRRLPWTLPEGDGGMNIRDGEVTVVSGYSKHGKTTLLDWICVNLAARYGERIMLASLEIPSEQTAQVLWRQCMGMRKPLDIYGHPDEALLDEGLEWLDKHFFFYNHVGRAKFAELLEVMKYAARRYAVKIFVLDSLMKLGVRKDDLNGHNELLDTLDVFSKQYRCHVFLVAHAKKPQDKDREWRHIPEKYEVEGSGDITNIACNTWVVQRNYQKEDAINNLEYSLSKTRDEKEVAQLEEKLDTERRKADAIWVVRAQRWGDGSTPKKFLYFDKNSWSYSEDYNFTPRKIAKPS